MVQTKKTEIRQAILDAAYELFSKRGYSATNITDIARSAGVAPANLYVYFNSKLEILFSIYEPWLTKQFDELEKSVRRLRSPQQRLRKILTALWRDIPSGGNGFANNWMQAISSTTAREGYSPTLRLATEERLAKMLDECLPNLDHVSSREIANIVLMAFDGYALNFHLNGGAICPARRMKLFGDILLNYTNVAAASPRAMAPRARPDLRSVKRTVANATARAVG